MAGVGGAIVGVAFAGGLVEHNYQEISLAAKDSAKFVGGVLRLLAVAILGGYLGVRLIDQVAERLLSQKIKQMEDKLDSVRSEFDVERTIRESAKSVRDGFPSRALGVLDELLQHVPHGVIRPDDLANVRVLRGYALKRLGRLREALQEVEASLRIKPTYAGWYNKACYTALLNPTVDDASTATVREALVEAHKLAESQGGTATLIRTLMEDTEGNGDLSALKNADFILEIVGD